MDELFFKEGGEPFPIPFGPWSEWTECSRTCGGGRQGRSRTCVIGPDAEFVQCTGPLLDARNCNAQPCPGIYIYIL